MQREIYVVSGMGRDVTGLVSLMTSIISDINGNIIDLEENVFHGFFSIFLTVDLTGASVTGLQFVAKMQAVAHQSGLQIIAEKQRFAARARPKTMMRLVLIGPDHPGIVSAATYVLANNGVNIERAEMISRGDLFAMEMDCDRGASPCSLELIERSISAEMDKVGIRPFFQTEDIYHKRSRLLVFWLSANLLDEKSLERIGAAGPSLSIGRDEAAAALKGLKVETVASITSGLRLSSEGEDILHSLKMMGFSVALVADGFDLFLHALEKYDCVDIVRGHRLLTDKGKLAGGIEELPQDGAGREHLIQELARETAVSPADVMVIGDAPPLGSPIRDCGVHAILDGVHLAKLIASGQIKKDQIPAIARAFGGSR